MDKTERKTDTGAESVAAPRVSHTPGPWHVSDTSPLMVLDEAGFYIAQNCGPLSADWAQADARLIAAAPDLLEALTLFLEDRHDEEETWRKAHAAITKARGE